VKKESSEFHFSVLCRDTYEEFVEFVKIRGMKNLSFNKLCKAKNFDGVAYFPVELTFAPL